MYETFPGCSGKNCVNINVASLLDLVKGIFSSVFVENVAQFQKIDEGT